MTVKLAKYNAAIKALAACVRVDEAKNIHDKAIAMTVYAKRAKERDLLVPAIEIRKRAERRIGELMKVTPKATGTRGKGRPRKIGAVKKTAPKELTLADQGIDNELAKRARKAAALSPGKFETELNKTIKRALASLDGNREVIREAREERQSDKAAKRAAREKDVANKILHLPQKRYGVIYADPEWRFEVWSRKTGLDRAADNHYSTSELDVIKSRDVASIAADDCVLFLWATVPMLPQALEVMGAWGFDYVSHIAWVKDQIGTGYWFRNKHELLLVGKRGQIPAPAEGSQFPSVIEAPVGEHSQKPDDFAEMIEDYFPHVPKIELNATRQREGWEPWGYEAPAVEVIDEIRIPPGTPVPEESFARTQNAEDVKTQAAE